MLEMHLMHPGFTYTGYISFTKNKKRIQKLKETRDLGCIYQNELVTACFQHDIADVDFKNLLRNIMNISADLLQSFINFLIKSFGWCCYICG